MPRLGFLGKKYSNSSKLKHKEKETRQYSRKYIVLVFRVPQNHLEGLDKISLDPTPKEIG